MVMSLNFAGMVIAGQCLLYFEMTVAAACGFLGMTIAAIVLSIVAFCLDKYRLTDDDKKSLKKKKDNDSAK